MAQSGRAGALEASGRWFESSYPEWYNIKLLRGDAEVAEKAHNLLVSGSIPFPAKD